MAASAVDSSRAPAPIRGAHPRGSHPSGVVAAGHIHLHDRRYLARGRHACSASQAQPLSLPFFNAGLVLEPLPVGAWAFLSVTTSVLTKTLTFTQAFSAFTSDVIWLIVVSFFFAKVGLIRLG